MTATASRHRPGSQEPDRAANLLGALALNVVDRLIAGIPPESGSLQRSAALSLVAQVPKCSIDWLSRRLELSHSATVRLVDGLERDGMLQRTAGPDRRTTSLVLTAAGRAAVTEMKAERLAVLRGFVEVLDTGQRDALVGAFEEMLHGRVHDPVDAWRICRLCQVERCVAPSCPVLDAVTPLLEGPS